MGVNYVLIIQIVSTFLPQIVLNWQTISLPKPVATAG
jgi:hypothetical protein